MTVKTGNDALLSLLSRGDLAANEVYYHKACYKNMLNESDRCDKLNNSENVNRNWEKARAFDKVINYIFEQEYLYPGSDFKVIDLNNMYVKQLQVYGIERQTQTTTFLEKLLSSIPGLYSDYINKKFNI